MPRETELRNRIVRLLNGQIRLDDLSRLFAWLRFRTHGADSIKEIGHFLAHPDERDQGVVTDAARDFFVFLPFHAEKIQFHVTKLPVDFPKIVSRYLNNRLTSEEIKQHTAMKRKVAARILSSALRKFGTIQDGNRKYCSIHTPLTPDEVTVLQCASNFLTAGAAFTEDSILRDFVFVLEKNKLIEPAEKPLVDSAKIPLALYVIAAMHGISLAFEDGSRGELLAGVSGTPERLLQVTALSPYESETLAKINPSAVGHLFFAAPMYSTTLKAAEWCVPELMDLLGTDHYWRGPIEMTPELKLAPL
jgi:hypothetical protein